MFKRFNEQQETLARRLKAIALGSAPTTADYQSAQERLLATQAELRSYIGRKDPEAERRTGELLTIEAALEATLGIK
jgi:hypothetical protein